MEIPEDIRKKWEFTEMVRDAVQHTSPSPETNKRLKDLENNTNDQLHMLKSIKSAVEDMAQTQLPDLKKQVGLLKTWQTEITTERKTLKVVWAGFSVFFIAACFGLFRMYVDFQGIEARVHAVVVKELEDYEFEIVE